MSYVAYRLLPGLDGPLPDELVIVRHDGDEYALDVSALMSNYQCIYGRGCKGTTPLEGEGPGRHRPADPSVAGCCRITPSYDFPTAEVDEADAERVDSPLRVKPYAEALGPDEAQHYEQIAAGDWYTEEPNDVGSLISRHTAVGGNCIFLNTEAPDGKLGCALYHLANRLGLDPKQTRPMVCHSAPAAAFTVARLADGGERIFVTLRPHWFGWFSAEGYFCMSDPAAFSAGEPVFRRMASEYSTLLGESVYAALLPVLDEIWVERGQRLKRNWGRPVSLPAPRWAR